MKHQKPFLSIIVPVFNESNRLYNLPIICKFFSKVLNNKSEIIIVNDGSTDGTLQMLDKFQKKLNFRIISYPVNRGKGFAVRQGMLNANGVYRLFIDVDLSTQPSEWLSAQKYLSSESVIIGIRRSKQSKVLIHQSWIRENMGRVFTWLSKTVLSTPVLDFTCGFKIFPQEVALQVFSRSRIDRWGFDSEILFLTHALGYSIQQLPVTWRNDKNSRVNLIRDTASSFIDLILIKAYSFLGSYTLTLT